MTNTIPTNMKNILLTNVKKTLSINFDDKNIWHKMDYYILYTVSLVIILLFISANICYHYGKYRSKQKCNNMKIENNELKKKEVCIGNRTECYFDNITKIEDFDFDYFLLNEK